VTNEYVATLERTSDMSAETEGAIKHARNRQRETVANILAEAQRRHRIVNGPTPPRPTPADEPTPADDDRPVAAPETDTPPSVDTHATPQDPTAAFDDAEHLEGPDGSADTDTPAYAVPLVNTFAARIAPADTE
jgi:hypothetical protein